MVLWWIEIKHIWHIICCNDPRQYENHGFTLGEFLYEVYDQLRTDIRKNQWITQRWGGNQPTFSTQWIDNWRGHHCRQLVSQIQIDGCHQHIWQNQPHLCSQQTAHNLRSGREWQNHPPASTLKWNVHLKRCYQNAKKQKSSIMFARALDHPWTPHQ